MSFLGACLPVGCAQLRLPAQDAASFTADRALDFGFPFTRTFALTGLVEISVIAVHGSCLSGAQRPLSVVGCHFGMQRLGRAAACRNGACGLTALRGERVYAGTARPHRNERKQFVHLASFPSA